MERTAGMRSHVLFESTSEMLNTRSCGYSVCCMSITIHKGNQRAKRVQVTFTQKQWDLIQQFRDILGSDDAEIVRNIVISWLTEKSVVVSRVKGEGGIRGTNA